MSARRSARAARSARATAAPAHAHAPWLALAGVLLVTLLVYLPSLGNGFTNWDDPAYVTANPLLVHPNLHDLLVTPVAGNYHPLTLLSLALDHRLFGLAPAPYHAVNLLFHLVNTALVFAFVWRLGRRRFWTALATALFFGIHPMHVESVAWIAERKDVLYTCAYLLGLLAYLRYLAERRGAWLALTFVTFVLALAAKPAAAVFPLTLLLLDAFEGRTDRARALLEKLPFLALALAGGGLTLRAQSASGALAPAAAWSAFQRLEFAAYGSVQYVLKFFVPLGLSAIYPYPESGRALGAGYGTALALLLVGLPALLFACRRLRPVRFGVAFFFVNLVLVLQFVTVGRAVMADRYTYVPYIGLLVALTWWLDERPARGSFGARARLAIAAVLLALLPLALVQTWTRCGVWHDKQTLWTDTIAKQPHRIEMAYNYAGQSLAAAGRLDDAIASYAEAIRIRGDYSEAYNNLGAALDAQGRPGEAEQQYRRAIALRERAAAAQDSAARASVARGRRDEAAAHAREAAQLRRDNGTSYFNAGAARVAQGRIAEAIPDFRAATQLDPQLADAYTNLGAALMRTGHADDAIAQFRRALAVDPHNATAANDLAQALQQSRGAGAARNASAPH